MFKNIKAFSGFSVKDIEEARTFYGDLLGLDVKKEEMGLLRVNLSTGGTVIIYPKENHVPATFTVLNFPVSDLDKAVDNLTEKGIVFEKYEGFGEPDAKGIYRSPDPKMGPDIAWFTDPSGNILAVMSDPQTP